MSVTEDDVVTGRLHLRMLGSPSVTGMDGEGLPGLGPGKPLALLCYLARQGEARREELTALLWGDIDEARARNAFRQSLHRLRQALGGVLIQQQDRLTLDASDVLWCDVDAFEDAIAADQIDEAVALYRGDFLEGMVLGEPSFDLWADHERDRLRSEFQTALDMGVRAAIAAASWRTAVDRARRLVEVAPYESAAALLLASALDGDGRSREAIATLDAFAGRSAEIGVVPPAEIQQRLAGRTSAPGLFRATGPEVSAPPIAAFVGRADSMALLNQTWSRARQGHGSTVLVTGDTGLGKSRLLDEFARALAVLDNPLLLRGRDARGATLPYAPIAEALRGTVRAPGLAGASEHLLAEAARIVPEFRDRFQLPPAGPVEDDAARLRFFEGIAAVLEAVSYEQPVCLILDGLEHGAPATIDLILYLSARLRGCAVLIACAGSTRTFERFERVTAGRPDDHVIRIDLGALENGDAASLVDSLPEAAAIPVEDRARIVGIGAGNALRLVELTRQLAAGVPLSAPLVTLREILAARLQAQPATHRRLFLAVALLGRPAPLRLLAASAHLSESATLDAALELEQDGLVAQTAEGLSPAHAVVAELAIEQAGAAGAALIAGWAADALAAEQPQRSAELADLYARAGRTPEAYRYALDAANEALRVGAFREAKVLLERAMEFAPDAAARGDVLRRLEMVGGGPQRLHAGDAVVDPSAPTQMTTWLRSRWLVSGVAVLGVTAIALAIANSARQRPVGHVLADTLLLVETEAPGDNHFFALTGQVADAAEALTPVSPLVAQPVWVDSVRIPWMNPRVSPDGGFVAIERMTEDGPDLFVISGDRTDTIAVATTGGDDFALDWAPDGSALLVSRSRTRSDQSYDTDLYLFRLANRSMIPLDTTSAREIVEADWSPDGAHVLWTARIATLNQQDIFVARADGSGAVNLSRHPAEDYRPTWAPDGTRIVFTSERDGNPDLYSVEVPSGAFARLTRDDAQDDNAEFSPDGRFIAFESTRGGESGVYVMASRGGLPARISPASRRMSLAGWRSPRVAFVDRIRLAGAGAIATGDSLRTHAEAVLSNGSVRALDGVTLRPLDTGIGIAELANGDVSVTGRVEGIARVAATLPGWRTDTLFLKVGTEALLALADDFAVQRDASDTWTAFGTPAAQILTAAPGGAGGMMVPRTGRESVTGMLSSRAFPASYGMSLRARIVAPFARAQPASLVLALVERPRAGTVDPVAPAFLPLASVSWVGEARRIAYAVEREVKTEPVSALSDRSAHDVEIRVEDDGRVAFFVDGDLRWRSTLRLASAASVSHVNVWLAGQTRGSDAGFDSVQLWVGGN